MLFKEKAQITGLLYLTLFYSATVFQKIAKLFVRDVPFGDKKEKTKAKDK